MEQAVMTSEVKKGALSKERNYGVDLLRCLAMFMIVVIHMNNQAGVDSAVSAAYPHSPLYYASRMILVFSLSAVNIYALISGYTMFGSSFKPRRFFSLWLRVFFIGVVLCAVGKALDSEAITKTDWLRALLPVTQNEYWYFSAYAGMFLLTPILNRGIRALSRKAAIILAFALFFLFSIGSMLGIVIAKYAFGLSGGYTVLWLTVLYTIGACLKKTDFLSRAKKSDLLITIAVCLILDLVWMVLPLPSVLKATKKQITSFLNPFAVILSICLLELFARLRFQRSFPQKLVAFFAPLTFSVYLIHLHPLFWVSLKNRFTFFASFPKLLIIPATLGTALAIYLVCSLLDWLRAQLFRLCRVELFCAKGEEALRKLCDRLYVSLFSPKKKSIVHKKRRNHR